MDKLGFGLDEDSSNPDQNKINPQDSRKLSIQRCVQSLVHSSHCRDANCLMPSCLNMKKIVAHAKQCERKTNRGCSVCKQFIALCYHHSKACQETKCPVLFCLNIRFKLRQQQLQQRMQQAQILKRRIATMQNRGMPSATAQNSAESSYAASQPSPVAQPPAPPYPTQPGLDMKPLITPSMNAMQTVQQGQTMRVAVPQHVSGGNVSYGKNNPMARPPVSNVNLLAQQMQAQMQKPLQPVLSGMPNRMIGMGNVNRWENTSYMQNSQPHQNLQAQPSKQMALRQQTQLVGSGNMPGAIGNSGVRVPSQIVLKQGPSLPNQQQNSLQTLIQTLKYPNSPQQQQQVLSILKSDPQLMAAFIKQRVMQKQQQQFNNNSSSSNNSY